MTNRLHVKIGQSAYESRENYTKSYKIRSYSTCIVAHTPIILNIINIKQCKLIADQESCNIRDFHPTTNIYSIPQYTSHQQIEK